MIWAGVSLRYNPTGGTKHNLNLIPDLKIKKQSKTASHKTLLSQSILALMQYNDLGLSCFLKQTRFVYSVYPSASFSTCTPLRVSQLEAIVILHQKSEVLRSELSIYAPEPGQTSISKAANN